MPHSKGFGRRKDRRASDPVPIGNVLDELLEQDELSRGIPIATLMRRWPELVGERLGTATRPASLEGGILTVSASDGPWGAQAKYLTEEIRSRADEALGGGVVRAVRVVIVGPPSETRNRR
jgi:predicted nucleic acid-binding Zn ribbon protein